MKHRSLVVLSIVALLATVVFSASLIAGQQRSAQPAAQPAAQPRPAAATPARPATQTAAKPYVVPKTVDGQPDLQGYWGNGTYTPLERPQNVTKEFYTEEEYKTVLKTRASGEDEQTTPGTTADVHYDFTQFALDTSQSPIPLNLRTSLIIDPPNGRLPARVGAQAGAGGGRGAGPGGGGGRGAGGGAAAAPAGGGRGAAPGGGGGANNQYDSIQNMPIGSRCIIMGGSGPPLMDAGYNSVYQIVQGKDQVMIVTEMIHDVRIIPIGDRPLPPEQLKQWIGMSRGHYEGNTLVVETTNFNGRRPFQGAGQNLRITERFTRVADDKIDYTFTATDETTWVSPWTASVPLTKEKGPIFEFACHETNYGPANILAGARATEKAAADAARK